MPAKQRVILLVLAVAAVVVAVVVIPSLGDDKKSSGAKTITVRDGKPVGGVQRLTFKKGQTVTFTVASDVADEIHVHGYDLKKDVPAGGRAEMSFKAKSDGIYEVELERRAEQIAVLRVNP